jgi:acyl carrier protein
MLEEVQPMATVNARELGLEATVDTLRQLLVDRFKVAAKPEAIGADEPLFAVGVGLSSLEGMELLAEIEKHYGVVIHNLDHWVDESPTLPGGARYLIDH